MISSPNFVRELPIPSYQLHSWPRCLSDFPKDSSTHSSYSTVGSSTVFEASGLEIDYAILITYTMRLIAPNIAGHSLAWGRNLLLHRKRISAATIDHNPFA